MKIKIVGLDPALRNLGIVKAVYDTVTGTLTIMECLTVCPVAQTRKQVRQNSIDLNRARQLLDALVDHTKSADIVCVEIPVGSQSSRACVSYGIAVSLMAVVQKIKPAFIEVSPHEVKITVGNKSATKQDVVDWVLAHNPEAPLEKHRGVISMTKAEHQADAIVAIYAAMKTPLFHSFKLALESKT